MEIGSRAVSVGFAGEALPRCVRSTFSINHDRFHSGLLPPSFGLESRSLSSQEKQDLYETLIQEQPELATLSQVYTRQQIHWLSSTTVGSLSISDRERLLIILHDIFIRELQVLPAICKVILVTSGWPMQSEVSILGTLLDVLGVKLVTIPAAPPLLILAGGQRHGLLVDFGWESTRIVPVYDLRDVSLASNRVEYLTYYTGKELHFNIVRQLIDLKVDVTSVPHLFQVVQAFVTTNCFVKPKDVEECESLAFELSPGVFIPSSFKWQCLENLLFADTSLVEAIKSVVVKSPIDLRPHLWKNIVLEGGISKIPGIRSRLKQELSLLCPKFKNLDVCGTLGLWAGASMYGEISFSNENAVAWKHAEFDPKSFETLMRIDGTVAFTKFPGQTH